ncbi:MAG: UvrD-helicase domain-containing protein [Clostridia bacterium]|nr:UvrD-helicase domain-containing protein [Clostridia bacterium]
MNNAENKPVRTFTPSQTFAINRERRELLLSAGAGSGKTSTLTERVCALVCDPDTGIDVSRILAVTFTKAAAEELRSRIRKRLEEALIADPSSRHLSRQLISLDSAEISTISSFFLNTIKPFYARLGLPPSFYIADDAVIDSMKKRIMNDVVDSFFERGDEVFISLADALASTKDEESINDAILKLCDTLISRGFTPEKLAAFADGVRADSGCDFFLSVHGMIIARHTAEFAKYYARAFEQLLSELRSEPFVYEKYSPDASDILDYIRALIKLAECGNYDRVKEHVRSYSPPRLPTIRGNDKTELSKKYQNVRNEFKSELKDEILSFYKYETDDISAVQKKSSALLSELAKIAGEYLAAFSREKRELGIVDFADVETFARKVLVGDDGKPTPAAKELSDKYDAIFIDEYQDTNRTEDDVFSAIAASVPRFMVGDVKQCIYAFRGSDPSVFVSYREKLPEADPAADEGENDKYGGCSLFMSENFRSDSTVIDFVNLISEYMFPGTSTPFENGDRLIFSKEHKEGYRETPVEICLVEKGESTQTADEDDGAVLPDNCDAEAEFTAEKISQLILHETKGDGTPIAPDDIVILLRNRKDAPPFVEALEKRGIRVSDTATEKFFERKEILLVYSLLTAIDNPLKDVYLAAAMKSPVFGFTVEDLAKIKLTDRATPLWYCAEKYGAEGEDPVLSEKCRSLISLFADLADRSKRCDAASFVLTLYDELSLLSLTDGSPADSAAASAIRDNLIALYDMARNYESSSYGGLYGFISYLTDQMEKGIDAAPSPAERGTVSVSTIHGSKGLEYPVCFLCRGSKPFNMSEIYRSNVLFSPSVGPAMKLYDGTGLVKCDNPLRAAVADKMKFELVCEEMRILYVAMTRAKERLIITFTVKDADEAIPSAADPEFVRTSYSVCGTKAFSDVIFSALKGAVKRGDSSCFRIYGIKRRDIGFTESLLAGEGDEEMTSEDLTELYRERLSFRYPNSYLSRIPAKVTVSRLTPSLLDDVLIKDSYELSEIAAESVIKRPAPVPKFIGERKTSGAEAGTATHVFLQFCDFVNLRDRGFDAELERLLGEKYITQEMASLIRRDEIEAFAKSAFFSSLVASRTSKREFRFNVALPADDFTSDEELKKVLAESGETVTVQGVIDVVFEDEAGRFVLADYKTDRLTPYELSHPNAAAKLLRERHKIQLSYYKIACEKIFSRKVDRVCIYSLALGSTVDII